MVGTASSGNHVSKEHGLLLFLPAELQLAHAKLQVDRKLGRSYAGLLALTEGFYKCGCLDKAEYDALKERYSMKLPCSIIAERTKPRTVEQMQEQTRLRKIEVDLSNVISNWATMPTKSRLFWLNKAKDFKGKISNAVMVLALGESKGGAVKQETLRGIV
jgi:hypothetical protein